MSDSALLEADVDGTEVADMSESQFEESYNQEDSFNSEDVGLESEESEEEESQEVDELAEIRQQLEEMKNEKRELQLRYDRLGNEVGELRKIAPKAEAEKPMDPQEYLQKFADDPEGMQKEMVRQELERRESEKMQIQQAVQSNRDLILKYDKDFEAKIPDIREWYKEKGASEDFINSLSPEAMYRSTPDLPVALAEIATLRKQLAEVKAKGPEMLKKINSKRGSAITSRNGKPTTQSVSDMQGDISSMSDKELKAYLSSTYI